jgi:hypothetical protein
MTAIALRSTKIVINASIRAFPAPEAGVAAATPSRPSHSSSAEARFAQLIPDPSIGA